MGHRKVACPLVFDAKTYFTRKSCWVSDGNKNPSLEDFECPGVVSRESVRIAFAHAALNGLEVSIADITNAFFQAPSLEKHFITCSPEFRLENAGKKATMWRALYGGKADSRNFRGHLRYFMSRLNFKYFLANPDVWMRPAIKSDGNEHYEHFMFHVEDALVASENDESILRD